mmetsp:Transcript_5177/g.7174  ORF Transcript_5177/g.7174 Transcript_5177/m.7174 type:complete len:311 (-) Transcript_5177:84-1016(-)
MDIDIAAELQPNHADGTYELKLLIVNDVDLECASQLVEWVLRREEIFDLCFVSGDFIHSSDFEETAQEESAREGAITSILAQLENIVCRVVYLPGPSDPAGLLSPNPPRLTSNSRNLHSKSLKILEGLQVIGYSETLRSLTTTSQRQRGNSQTICSNLFELVKPDVEGGNACLLFSCHPDADPDISELAHEVWNLAKNKTAADDANLQMPLFMHIVCGSPPPHSSSMLAEEKNPDVQQIQSGTHSTYNNCMAVKPGSLRNDSTFCISTISSRISNLPTKPDDMNIISGKLCDQAKFEGWEVKDICFQNIL